MAKPGQADAARAKRGKRRVLFAASGRRRRRRRSYNRGSWSEPGEFSKGFVPIPLCASEFLSKIGTHLLDSSDIRVMPETNRNSLACLTSPGSYFAVTYCRGESESLSGM